MRITARDIRVPRDLARAPVGKWIGRLGRCWGASNCLRKLSPDAQISGYAYGALGALCDVFIKSPEGEQIIARWDGRRFFWNQGNEIYKVGDRLPCPVARWWDNHHMSVMSSRELIKMVPVKDNYANWDHDKFAVLLAVKFGIEL